MRNRLLALLLAVAGMIGIVVVAIVVLDDNAAEVPSIEPTVLTAPIATPTPDAREPTFAPDGRTGNADLDRIIYDFLTLDAATLVSKYGDVTGSDWTAQVDETVDAAQWAPRLAAAERSLYSVTRVERSEFSVFDTSVLLSVVEAEGKSTGWDLRIRGLEVVDIYIADSRNSLYGDVVYNYDSFIVLPPQYQLPRPPAYHDLTVRTGEPGLDNIVALLAARDAGALIAIADPSLTRRECRTPQESNQTTANAVLREIVARAVGLHSVVILPEGHEIAGDHLIILILQESRYTWSVAALAVRDGKIAGFDKCDTDRASYLYPPRAYPAPPLAGLADLDPARRSGIEVIDTFLDALAASNLTTLLDLVVYQQVGCIVEPVGIGGPPFCEEGEPVGTVLDVLPMGVCEGFYQRRRDVPATLQDLIGKTWALYSVADLGPPTTDTSFFSGNLQVILADTNLPDQPVTPTIALTFSNAGLTSISLGCGPIEPQQMISPGRTPDFLLPPA